MSPLWKAVAAAAVLAVLSACSGDKQSQMAEPATSSSTVAPDTTTTTEPPTTTTTAPPTTTTTLPGLGPGAKGPEVRALEQRLSDLRYDPGKVDGVFDATTGHAVLAFQKVNGMARTSRATPDVVANVSRSRPPSPLLASGGATRVEIDVKRQVLFLWKDGALARILPVSSGNGKRYCVEGECATAVTPGGSYRVGRKIRGLRVSRLGQLYNPLYFNGGIAIHGASSVPAQPASHGCVRIPMSASLWFFDAVPSGTPVYVFGGPRAPVPFNEAAPGEAPPGPPPPPLPDPTPDPPPPSPLPLPLS
ncbi:MAG TPA: L,D-transpeptidase family protein [Acidimicrobiales bacterium]|nr:L,D-transpeptidase family protein [Acidimicrobiales bacterium]